jgi:hypothetical protein
MTVVCATLDASLSFSADTDQKDHRGTELVTTGACDAADAWTPLTGHQEGLGAAPREYRPPRGGSKQSKGPFFDPHAVAVHSHHHGAPNAASC